MESKKTESVKKKGWDKANQVLTDNFGNVYDFKNQTINGVPCTLNRILDEECNDINEFFIEIKAKNNPFTLTINNRQLIVDNSVRFILVDRNHRLTEINDIWGHARIMNNNTCQLDANNYLHIGLEYNDDNCKGMQIIGEMTNNMIGSTTTPGTGTLYHTEQWLDDRLVFYEYDRNNEKTTVKVYPKLDGNRYSNQPVFNQTFTGEQIKFLDKQGDLIYFFGKNLNNTQKAQYDKLYAYNAKYNEIITEYELPELPNYFDIHDLKKVVKIMHQNDYKKDYNFQKALSKYLKSRTAKYNMNTPSRRGWLRGG